MAVISDTHFKSGIDGVPHQLVVGLMLSDMQTNKGYDGLLIAGDVTNYGKNAEWKNTENTLKKYNAADRTLLAVGNHDTWTRGDGNRTTKGLFMEYTRKITGRMASNVYYSTEINGYSFIFLSSESDSTEGYFSNKQIKWFRAEMKKAAEKDLPIFVVCHWPINMTHGLPVSWGDDDYDDMTGGIGKQCKKINKILQQYDNVFFISGHIHNGLSGTDDAEENGYQSLEKVGNIYSLNLPTVWIGENGYPLPGTGYTMEVYDDEILFRARNFISGTWIPEYDYAVQLEK